MGSLSFLSPEYACYFYEGICDRKTGETIKTTIKLLPVKNRVEGKKIDLNTMKVLFTREYKKGTGTIKYEIVSQQE